MVDRFGQLPEQVDTLFDAVRLRWLCKELGFERCIFKNNKLQCFFVLNPQSAFYESSYFKDFLAFIGNHGAEYGIALKQSRQYLILIKDEVNTFEEAKSLLENLSSELLKKDVTIDA
jgi:transcription-repair coupling factor (superfamily II helicase)